MIMAGASTSDEVVCNDHGKSNEIVLQWQGQATIQKYIKSTPNEVVFAMVMGGRYAVLLVHRRIEETSGQYTHVA